MQSQKYVASVVRRILIERARVETLRNIKDLIAHLEGGRQYLRYPYGEYPPTIAEYSFFRKSDLKWLNFYYSIYGKADPNFVSVPVYSYVEMCVNDRMLLYGVKEKNVYNKFFAGIPTPATVLRRINGFYYDDKFQTVDGSNIMRLLNGHKKVILKPSIDSGHGSGISVFQNDNGILSNGKDEVNLEFLELAGKDWIIQEFVTQHSFFSQFNPTCNNTVKIFVYRSVKDDSINLLHAIFWVGAKGGFLDHDQWGGFGLSISENNEICGYAIDVYGKKYESVHGIKLSSLGKVPAMDEMRKLAKEIAGNVYYGRLLAIDFTVDSEGRPLMLEINCRHNGIHQYQMHNGGLFREFTKEILDYCQKYQPRFCVRI